MSVPLELTVPQSIIANKTLENAQGIGFVYPGGSEAIRPNFSIMNNTAVMIGFYISNLGLTVGTTDGTTHILMNWENRRGVEIIPGQNVPPDGNIVRYIRDTFHIPLREARNLARVSILTQFLPN